MILGEGSHKVGHWHPVGFDAVIAQQVLVLVLILRESVVVECLGIGLDEEVIAIVDGRVEGESDIEVVGMLEDVLAPLGLVVATIEDETVPSVAADGIFFVCRLLIHESLLQIEDGLIVHQAAHLIVAESLHSIEIVLKTHHTLAA